MAHSNELNQTQVTVTAVDLPLHCPMPQQKLWNSHPRVFLPLEKTGHAKCPYCGTEYTLSGPVKAGH